jgi:prepilin-type N-terminal cleavage/methylation domain-containing protein
VQLIRSVRSDSGFTVVELLVTMVILVVITVPLANVVISALRNTDSSSDRLSLSHDAQIAAAYFARDVSTVGVRDYSTAPSSGATVAFKPSVQLSAEYDAGGRTCGTATTPTAILRLLADAWEQTTSPPTAQVDVVAYYLKGNGDVSELHRIKCIGPSTTPESDVVLAHNVDPSTISVTCSSTCETADVPEEIRLTFTVKKPSTEPYVIALNGQRRQS